MRVGTRMLFILLPLVFILMLAGAGMANQSDEKIYNYVWEFGTDVSFIKYVEPGLMQEEGMMYGLTASYTYRNKIMLRPEIKGSFGDIDYSSPRSGTINNIRDYMVETRVLLGYDFDFLRDSLTKNKQVTITPYVGFGYRYLEDNGSKRWSSARNWGYNREAHYIYSPLGLEFFVPINDEWAFGATGEYDFFWKGIQRSYLSARTVWFNNLVNDQHHGYGVRGSVKLQKRGEKFDVVFEPYIKYWYIHKSDDTYWTFAGIVIGRGWEPKNHSSECGAKLAIRF